jgi:hypothetical protein
MHLSACRETTLSIFPWARANRPQAARLLGISRRQLFDTIRQHGLQEQANEPET